jgi:hypothetical protein
VVLLLAIAFVLGFNVYTSQQQKIDRLSQQITDLNSQLALYTKQNDLPTNLYTSKKGVKITIFTPHSSAKVTSPLSVIGEVPGSWSFEASFPVILKDSKGTVLAQAPAQLLGDWMTDKMVPFSIKLPFSASTTTTGTLTLQKDNPSGLPANDDSLTIPVQF